MMGRSLAGHLSARIGASVVPTNVEGDNSPLPTNRQHPYSSTANTGDVSDFPSLNEEDALGRADHIVLSSDSSDSASDSPK
jgi:hypothetical protein